MHAYCFITRWHHPNFICNYSAAYDQNCLKTNRSLAIIFSKQKGPSMKTNLKNTTFFRFLLVGILNTLIGNASIFLLYNVAGWSYWMSTVPIYILVSLMSFFLNKYFTFCSKVWSWGEFARFFINIFACYLVAYTLSPPLIRLILADQSAIIQGNVSIFTAMCLFTVLNYFGQRFFAFLKRPQP